MPSELCGASGEEGPSEGPGTSELGSSVPRIFEAELVEAEDVSAAGAQIGESGEGPAGRGVSTPVPAAPCAFAEDGPS